MTEGGAVRPVIPVVVFPGSNDDRDAQRALELLGARAPRLWHTEERLPLGTAAVVLPGGFSYGDYLRCGAIARFSPVMGAVVEFAADGGLVLGICNGFQILTEAGLLPGALRPNASLSFVCRDVPLLVGTSRHAVHLPLRTRRPGADDPREARRRLLVRRRRAARPSSTPTASCCSGTSTSGNPNGAVADVAGVVNDDGNVFGLMPHPEHAVDPLLGSTDGALILGSLVDAARLSLAVSV